MGRRNKMLLLTLTVMMFMGTHCQDNTLSVTSLTKLIQTKNQMTTHMISIKSNVDRIDGLKKFINILKDLKNRVGEFMGSPVYLPEWKQTLQLDTLRKAIRNDEHKARTDDPLFSGFTLAENNNRHAWKLFEMISEDIAKSNTVQLPQICQAIGSKSHSEILHDLKEISIKNLCKDVSSCPSGKTLYSEKRPKQATFDPWVVAYKMLPKHWQHLSFKMLRKQMLKNKWILKQLETLHNHLKSKEESRLRIKYKEQDVSSSCNTDRMCDVKQVLPMMTRILWYQINEMIFQRICPQNCQGGKCNYLRTSQTALEDTDRLISYAASLPSYWTATWDSFYKGAVAAAALTDPNVAMSKVGEKKSDFEISNKQCNLIKLTKACANGDLFKLYKLLKKIQQSRKNGVKVKDLRSDLSNYRLSMLLSFEKYTLQELQALKSITRLDDNLYASVPFQIISIFMMRANSDVGSATYRVRFIKDKLDGYEKSLKALESQLKKDIRDAMTLMTAVVPSNLTEKIANLSILIVTKSNPLKLLFSSTDDMEDVLDQLRAEGARDIALIHTLNNLTEDSLKLRTAFGGNSKQIPSLQNVVKKIRNGQSGNIGQDADNFLEEYIDYTPMADSITRYSLAKNDVLWSAFKNSICNVLNGEVGIAGSVPKAIAGGTLLCKRFKGTLDKFFKQREYIFDFQFELVNTIATVVLLGNIGHRFASSTKERQGSLQACELMTGFLIVQYHIQKIASYYCDQMEYKNLGKPVSACSSVDGMFMKYDIFTLVDYTDTSAYNEDERDVFIPTQPQAEGDLGYIDLQALGKGETVVFKIPSDLKWLEKHKWVLPGQTVIPFVQSLQLYLPRKGPFRAYEETNVNIISIAESSVSALNPNASVVYLLPNKAIYYTEYELVQDFPTCYLKEVVNPYSLCNNLPKACNHISRMSTPDAILPTALSTWSVKVSIYRDLKERDYDAPSPQTNLLLVAKAVFRVLKNTGWQRDAYLPLKSVLHGCCKGNTYRWSRFNRTCDACPQGTTSYHGGLFCQ